MPRCLWLYLPLIIILTATPAFAASFSSQLEQAAKAYQQNQPEKSLERMREAMQSLWEKLPFSVGNAHLLQALPGSGSGIQIKPDNTYHSGQTIILYLEPVGFKVKHEQGLYLYSLEVDFVLKDAFGHHVTAQKRFSTLNGPAISFPDHLSMVVSYNLKGLTPGDYNLQTTVRDTLSGREHSLTNLIRILSAGYN